MNVRLNLKQVLQIPTKFKNDPITFRFELFYKPLFGRTKTNCYDYKKTFETYEEMEDFVEFVEMEHPKQFVFIFYKRTLYDVVQHIGCRKVSRVATLHRDMAEKAYAEFSSAHPDIKFSIIKRTSYE